MASQQVYQAYAQNKGTLIPGQTILVNKFNVQVERYLSQGGFAHVYLVRTATPVYNTTHHVLKRIAVANEAMLTDVKKEVDIMRLLKGHPNIVHLIDAAWQRMPDGTYEVFILMEYCPGGGIIDMMNRRLRERLTEAEILQIFVDVCEGVAYMHNLRPPLLHRDLKVENILQSSPTSFKLCDFGSASTVSKPPTNTQEIRALEADLNRHTTLQYRAPEMVDLYSRKPVDEKSDVWALGVLLYKLCYYTTPFEEHGQLAILNVQYRIPPYPVYSPQMNQLIASMLQEHGIRRPSVFQLLEQVHRLRGTKSRFKYIIPVPQPLSPRSQTQFKPPPSPNRIENAKYTAPNAVIRSVTPSGRGDREENMEAIAPLVRGVPTTSHESRPASGSQKYPDPQIVPPMRRGRPTVSKESASSSNNAPAQKATEASLNNLKADDWLEGGFAPDDDGAWKAIAARDVSRKAGSADAWNVDGKELKRDGRKEREGFGDDFGQKLWDSVEKSTPPHSQPRTSPNLDASSRLAAPTRAPPPSGTDRRPSPKRDKDAFDGLGLGLSERPAPTLGEARKLRTGLAVMNVNGSGFRHANDMMGSGSSRLTPSRQPNYSQTPSQSQPMSSPPLDSTMTSPSFRLTQRPVAKTNTTSRLDGLPAESRFPSLEELDASFAPSSSSSATFAPSSPSYSQKAQDTPTSSLRRNDTLTRPNIGDTNLLKPDPNLRGLQGRDGVRSEQVTGVAMRESRGGNNGYRDSSVVTDRHGDVKSASGSLPDMSRPNLVRKHRSSVTVKHALYPDDQASTSSTVQLSTAQIASPPSPRVPVTKPMDWLTGDDDENSSSSLALRPPSPAETPILRDSPSKRASLIQRSNVPIPAPVIAQHGHTPLPKRSPSPSPVTSSAPTISPTLSRFTRAFPPIEETDQVRKVPMGDYKDNRISSAPLVPETPPEPDSASSADEGPEDATAFTRTTPKATQPAKRRSRKGRQSSVHDLVDLYGGGLAPKDKDRDTPSTHRNDTEVTPQAHKGRAMVPPLSSSKSNPASASHQLLSPLDIASPDQQKGGKDHRRSSPTSAGPTPSPSSRSRPQSMFIFPSKSSDVLSPHCASRPSVSPGLIPPEDLGRRTRRRTSISDMVQRYEGISGNTKATGVPPSPGLSRPISKMGQGSSEGRYSRSQVSGEGDRAGSSLPIPGDVGSSRGPAELTQMSPGQISTIRTYTPLHHDTLSKESDDVMLRNTSLKPEIKADISRPRFPLRKSTEDSSSPRPDNRSSSPERPYQGVGKLIDQWQRKTAEADPPRAPGGIKRSTFAGKRAGVVHDSSR